MENSDNIEQRLREFRKIFEKISNEQYDRIKEFAETLTNSEELKDIHESTLVAYRELFTLFNKALQQKTFNLDVFLSTNNTTRDKMSRIIKYYKGINLNQFIYGTQDLIGEHADITYREDEWGKKYYYNLKHVDTDDYKEYVRSTYLKLNAAAGKFLKQLFYTSSNDYKDICAAIDVKSNTVTKAMKFFFGMHPSEFMTIHATTPLKGPFKSYNINYPFEIHGVLAHNLAEAYLINNLYLRNITPIQGASMQDGILVNFKVYNTYIRVVDKDEECPYSDIVVFNYNKDSVSDLVKKLR